MMAGAMDPSPLRKVMSVQDIPEAETYILRIAFLIETPHAVYPWALVMQDTKTKLSTYFLLTSVVVQERMIIKKITNIHPPLLLTPRFLPFSELEMNKVLSWGHCDLGRPFTSRQAHAISFRIRNFRPSDDKLAGQCCPQRWVVEYLSTLLANKNAVKFWGQHFQDDIWTLKETLDTHPRLNFVKGPAYLGKEDAVRRRKATEEALQQRKEKESLNHFDGQNPTPAASNESTSAVASPSVPNLDAVDDEPVRNGTELSNGRPVAAPVARTPTRMNRFNNPPVAGNWAGNLYGVPAALVASNPTRMDRFNDPPVAGNGTGFSYNNPAAPVALNPTRMNRFNNPHVAGNGAEFSNEDPVASIASNPTHMDLLTDSPVAGHVPEFSYEGQTAIPAALNPIPRDAILNPVRAGSGSGNESEVDDDGFYINHYTTFPETMFPAAVDPPIASQAEDPFEEDVPFAFEDFLHMDHSGFMDFSPAIPSESGDAADSMMGDCVGFMGGGGMGRREHTPNMDFGRQGRG